MSNIDNSLTEGLSKLGKLFTKKDKVSIGVDIGARSIKIVELERAKEGFALKDYALVSVQQDLVKAGTPGLIHPQTGATLREVFNKLKIKNKKINVAVPSFSALITAMEIPAVDESEVDSLLSVEAPKYIPIPLKEVVYGWQAIPIKTVPSKNLENLEAPAEIKSGLMKILLVALMNDVSKKYEAILSDAGFEVNCIEVDSFSVKRSLVGNDTDNHLILDVGEKMSNIIITYNGSVAISRNIDIAGSRITEIIANSMKVSMEKANQLKVTSGLKIDTQFGSNIIETALKSIIAETKKAMDLFVQSYPGEIIKDIILNGGTAKMPGFKEYIEKELSIKVFNGNPWTQISCAPEVQQSLIDHGSVFSVAVGLALLGFEEHE